MVIDTSQEGEMKRMAYRQIELCERQGRVCNDRSRSDKLRESLRTQALIGWVGRR